MKARSFSLITSAAFAAILVPGQANAHSVYLGVGNSEQLTIAGDRELAFDPLGQSILVSFNLSDNLSLSVDYYQADDAISLNQSTTGELDITSWRVNLGYYVEDWSFSVSASEWQDELDVTNERLSFLLDQNTEAPSLSANVGYDWYKGSWQIGVGLGAHYNDWEQSILSRAADRPETSGVDSGESTFVSVSLSLARFIELSDKQGLIVGTNLQWNEILDTESEAVSRNGRNISQISNRRLLDLINSQVPIGSESYGQISAYVSYDISENWLIDVNYAWDIASDQNTNAWSVNLGYSF